ncbi:MAG: peroxiredoxin-like family protein [Acidobacteriota bacterium]|nr:peroxiredoxin-like family protein [Acidobacteriota bacterium]
MFCREQVAQLRDVEPQIRDRGARLLVVGNGSPSQAARFQEERELSFPLLTDPDLTAYAAAGLRRNLGSTFRLGVIKNAARALSSGHRQGSVQGDPWQQGGAFIFTPEDEVLFSQISREGGDHVDPQELLEHIPAG